MSLYRAGLGCYIGHMFVGALAYADDLILLAPTPHAMQCMLQLSAEYAKDYDVLFNANKSKCLICRPSGFGSKGNLSHDVCFYIGLTVIQNVVSWPHLGHVIIMVVINWILSCRCNFIGQANNVICWFSKLDCCIKTRLLKAQCFSFYGSEL